MVMKRKIDEVSDTEEGADIRRKRLENGLETTDDEELSSSGSADYTSREQSPVVHISISRERRSNAGNRMASLLNDMEEDEFYKNTYGGGFLEDDADDAYESPVGSDHDEIDSDFYNTEEEDEPISDNEQRERPKRRAKYRDLKPGDFMKRKQLLDKNRKWVMARMGGPTVAANTVSPETQAEMLEEAKETERLNIASLKKYEQYELERKKKREKNSLVRSVKPPLIKMVDTASGRFLTLPSVKEFKMPETKVRVLCAVTSRPAKYRDPVTGLPYADVDAFKNIRQKYIEYLKTIKNNSAVTAWLEEYG
ncbi:unnamed protein product [Enterobius vermicularis]|uniref:Vacuolar protein sorting-associated protein 72 homolog n=1 Tax=Enterobius vermicularis TaxID=51028 RepID=A0A0N4VGX1_ENTVE|nr:unnamed protein product [Enterobius vermicularis]